MSCQIQCVTVTRHPHLQRLACITLDHSILIPSQDAQAELMMIANCVRAVVMDRAQGMVMLQWSGGEGEPDQKLLTTFCKRLAVAMGRILPETRNTDGRAMKPAPSIQISLDAESERSPVLRHFTNPELDWPLHTDRVLHENPGDFLMVCKLEEQEGSGGAIRLLHLDDWDNHQRFVEAPWASAPVQWKGDPQMAPAWLQPGLRKQRGIVAPVFDTHPVYGQTIRFSDERFRSPQSLHQQQFLSSLTYELKSVAARTPTFDLPHGGIYIVNNHFVLHGRRGFQASAQFRRRLLRICGDFNMQNSNFN